MKRKRKNWDRVAWTPFVEVPVPADADAGLGERHRPRAILVNSRYQVTVFGPEEHPVVGKLIHLSFKTHDKAARHDWRDMQRIKNEIVGPEFDAVEVYPAESKLVDTANQYHLFVFLNFKLPFGFQERLVGDGDWQNAKQRPFEVRPPDCLDPKQYDERLQDARAKAHE